MKQKILIAEDDKDILNLLKLYLENDEYSVISADNGKTALELSQKEDIDLAILDIMMPEMDGYTLVKNLRKFTNIPIIILSAKNQDNDKILGLNLGADDYMTKPFNPLELTARVKSHLRRFNNFSTVPKNEDISSILTVGELKLNTETCTLTKNDIDIPITPMEYKILALLMKNPKHIFTKRKIYENISGTFFESDENTIMVHMSRIRDKIETDAKNPVYIKTVRGLGYKIDEK